MRPAALAFGNLGEVSTPRLLVIQHAADCPPAWFGEDLRAAGVDTDIVRGDHGQPVPGDLGPYAGLVVLGGDMGANDDAEFPWLTSTKALIASVVQGGQCFLGICLGHQLAAVAMGGEVIRNPQGPATGLTPVKLTPAGEADVLLRGVGPHSRAIQWNHDIVSRLPPGAPILATAPDGTIQAARFGQRAWGVQFHPEASPAVFDEWTSDERSDSVPQGFNLADIARDVADAEPELRSTWAPLTRRFAGLVREQLPVS